MTLMREMKFDEYEYLDEAYAGDSCNWSTVELVRAKSDGWLYVGYDAGCSCNSFNDYGDVVFTRVTNMAHLAQEVKKMIGEEGMDLISRLAVNPPKFHIEPEGN